MNLQACQLAFAAHGEARGHSCQVWPAQRQAIHTGHGGSAFPKIAELSLQPVVGTAILVLTNRQVQVEVHIGTEDVKELAAHLFRKISGLGVFQPDHV